MDRRQRRHPANVLPRLRTRAVSLLEVIIAGSILSLILTLIFGTFRVGLTASLKSMGQNEVLSQLQVGTRTLHRELSQTNIDSVSISPAENAVSFLTHYDVNGAPVTGLAGQPVWQAYLVLYLDSADDTLKQARIELTPSSPLS